MRTTERLTRGQVRILPDGTPLTILRPSIHRGEWVVWAVRGEETRQGATLRALPVGK